MSAVKAKARRALSPTARAKDQILHRQQDSGLWLGPWKALLCLAKGRQQEFQWPSSRVLSQGQESFPCQSCPPKTRPGASHARSRKILPAEETALRFFRAVRPRNSIKTVALRRFMEFSHCCHADFHGSAPALPWQVQGLWTISAKNLALEQSCKPWLSRLAALFSTR